MDFWIQEKQSIGLNKKSAELRYRPISLGSKMQMGNQETKPISFI